MKSSLARRIFLSIFAIGAINVLVTLIAIEYIYEDMEDTILRMELAEERSFLEQRIEGPHVQQWGTALLTAIYVPRGEITELPKPFEARPVPFSAEVELDGKTYLISIEETVDPPGVLYLAQDISLLEDREDYMQLRIALLCLGMLTLGLLLARHGTARVLRPLRELTREIRRIAPGTAVDRIRGNYAEQELDNIARTLNEMLEALDAYVRREKSMISLASHELRTPLAVIAGALDVLDQRATLAEADRRTLQRIRRATDEMQHDVTALLKLARRADNRESASVDLAACVSDVVAEIETSLPEASGRITWSVEEAPSRLMADPALVRMLLRNLLQNAVRHTGGKIEVHGEPHRLTVSDSGPGLPDDVGRRIANTDFARQPPEDGLGLFIVRLICERLDWQLHATSGSGSGTVFELEFGPSSHFPPL